MTVQSAVLLMTAAVTLQAVAAAVASQLHLALHQS
jgi:hypothetical protein